MAIIVFEVVTLILERVERLVLDLPATAAAFYQATGILCEIFRSVTQVQVRSSPSGPIS